MAVATALVDRATSDMLVGADWSVNMEICDILNAHPGQTKDVVKLLKKRLNSKRSKVQLLTLTLLEALIKNCGDTVHLHVADKDVLREMVKIVKKKPDFHVKEKILVLIDAWQEAFGGPRARYPQYYAAYQELLRAGVVFPQRAESSVPIFTPPQTNPVPSYPQSIRKPELYNEAPESSARPDLPSLSLTEIQNAHGVVDVLSEMLSAMDPSKKEDLKQEVIVDLVDQCHSYKQRVIQLVNTTSDERLLSQGLALNDDLQRVLAQRDAIACGIAVKVEKQRPSAGVPKVDIKAQDAVIQLNGKISTTAANTIGPSSATQSLSPATPTLNGSITPTARVPQIDLLSGDFNPPENENPLALVPVSVPSTTSTSDQNVLALSDMFAQNSIVDNQPSSSSAPLYASQPFSSFAPPPPYSMPQVYATASNNQMTQSPKFGSMPLYPSLNGANMTLPQIGGSHQVPANQPDRASQTWNTQGLNMQQLRPPNLGNADATNGQIGEALPPPPWEMPQTDKIQPGMTGSTQLQMSQGVQMGGIYPQHLQQNPQSMGGFGFSPTGAQMAGTVPYQLQGGLVLGSQTQATQMPGGGYNYERWMAPQAAAQYYEQTGSQYPYPYTYPYPTANNLSPTMHGMQTQGSSSPMYVNPSYQLPTSSSPLSSKQPAKPSRPEDNLFGDLVNFAKSRPNRPGK